MRHSSFQLWKFILTRFSCCFCRNKALSSRAKGPELYRTRLWQRAEIISLRGLSLAEVIVSSFILVAGMVVSASLYDSALSQSVRIDRRYRAARAAERRLEEIRSWSQDQQGTNGPKDFTQGWDEFDGKTTTDSDYPEFQVTTRTTPYELYSPSSAFEKIAFAAQADDNVPARDKKDGKPRVLGNSCRLVLVEARWGTGPKDVLVSRSLITDPVKDYGWKRDELSKAIELSYSMPSILGRDDSMRIKATIKDAKGGQVKNAVVTWYIDAASSGKGTLETLDTATDEVEFLNVVKVIKDPEATDPEANMVRSYTGGWVRVVARVRLGGVEAIQKTEKIILQDPPS